MSRTPKHGVFEVVIEGNGYSITGVPARIEGGQPLEDWEDQDWDSIRISSSYDYTVTFADGTVVDRVKSFTAFRIHEPAKEVA